MGLFARFKEYREKRQRKAEDRVISNVATANERIKELETRRKVLDERERIFRQRDSLQNDVKVKEQAVKDLEYKQTNPVMYAIKQNVNRKLQEAKKERMSRSIVSGVKKTANSPSDSYFTGSQDSKNFLKHATGSFSNPVYGKTNTQYMTGGSPFSSSQPKPKAKRKQKQIVIRL